MKIPETQHQNLHLSTTHLLTSLLSQLPNIQTFKSKWSSIKLKLTHLPTHLSDLSDFPNFTTNPLSSDLLKSISQTLTHATTLAHLCSSPNPTAGKLKTQSDLDSLLANLDQHLKDIDLLIRSGVLQDQVLGSGCSSGSNTGTAATTSGLSRREAVRVEARSLITRLQIGSVESKVLAMDCLLGLLSEDDKNVLIAVAQGAVQVLVKMLDSSCVEIKEKAVSAISRVSMVESSKHVLVAEGVLLLNHLLRVLESGSGFAKEKACVALQALSVSKENARAIGSRGGIGCLLEICQGGTPSSQAVAAGVLRNLAVFAETRQNFVEENAWGVLVGLVGSGTNVAQENAIECLSHLVCEDESLKVMVAKEGGIECLKTFWDGASQARSLEIAVGFLRSLASYRPIGEVLVNEGFIARLVAALSFGAAGVRIAAAKGVYELGFSTKTRKEMGDCGCVSPLVKMLDVKAVEEKEASAKALSCLMQCAGNRRILQKEERGILGTVQLLDPSIHNLEKKYPIAILLSMAQSKRCRKQMVAAGACGYVQKLVEMDVEGAKKLMEILSRGKLWGVFPRA